MKRNSREKTETTFEKVTIAIGATDESESLIKTIDSINEACNREDIDSVLIVIPENASAACVSAVRLLEKKYPGFVCLKVQNYPNIGGAVRSAIETVESSHIMFLSADIPTALETIPEMIEQAKKNPSHIVKISRWIKKNSFYGYDKTRKNLNRMAQIFLRLLFCSEITDFTAPVLISSTHIYKGIFFKEFGFPCLLEMILIPVRMKKQFIEVPTKCLPRTEGKSKNSWLQTALYLKTAIRVRFTPKSKLYHEVNLNN